MKARENMNHSTRSEFAMPARLFDAGGRWGSAAAVTGTFALVVLACLASSAAFGANAGEEMAKLAATAKTTGGTDPHGDSWVSIQNSLQQFSNWQFVVRLFLSFTLAVICSWVIAWHPRRPSILDPMDDLEERKAIVVLGMVGAIVAELAGSSPPLAFVIFGIGALLRFRTVLGNPKLTGKAITVVVIGLACGMGSWVMAVFITLFAWILLYLLESHVGCRIRVRLGKGADAGAANGLLLSLLNSKGCQVLRSDVDEDDGRMVYFLNIPAGIDPRRLESELRETLPAHAEAEVSAKVS